MAQKNDKGRNGIISHGLVAENRRARFDYEIGDTLEKLIESSDTPDILKISSVYVTYLMDNDQYFRMMTHFMLDGTLGGEMLEKLNTAERELFDQLDRLFVKLKISGDTRMLSHAFFAALNGVLISFRNYPGRDRAEIEAHMIKLGKIIAQKFKGESI